MSATTNTSASKRASGILKKFAGKSNASAGNMMFPTGLSESRYVIIQVFDTSEGDPNAKLASMADTGVNAYKTAFSSIGSALGGKTEGLNKEMFAGVSSMEAAKVAGQGIGSNLGDMWDSTTSWMAGMNDPGRHLGNQALTETWKDNLWLPLPNEIAESLTHNYAAQDGGTASIPGLGDIQQGLTGLVTGPSNVMSKLTGRQKLLTNMNKISVFTSTDFRSITLTWTMVANNKDEAKAIQEIITALKAYSSPQSLSNRLLLRAPYFVRLTFPNKVINDALQFRETVMTSIAVNYSPTGHMETFHDDMPKVVHLSITFKDREPKTAQAWASDDSPWENGAGGGTFNGSKGSGASGSTGASGSSKSSETKAANGNTEMVQGRKVGGDDYDPIQLCYDATAGKQVPCK